MKGRGGSFEAHLASRLQEHCRRGVWLCFAIAQHNYGKGILGVGAQMCSESLRHARPGDEPCGRAARLPKKSGTKASHGCWKLSACPGCAVACAGCVLAVQWAVLLDATGWPAALLSRWEAEGVLGTADLCFWALSEGSSDMVSVCASSFTGTKPRGGHCSPPFPTVVAHAPWEKTGGSSQSQAAARVNSWLCGVH